MAFNATNPVTVGAATKADHYDRVFNNTLALQDGSKELTKVTLDGAASDPSVSPAGDAVLAYNTTSNQLRVSKNGGAYEDLGAVAAHNDPVQCGGTLFGFRW